MSIRAIFSIIAIILIVGSLCSAEVIKLEPKGIKSWKSKTEYIKEYSLIGFALFLIVVLMIKWLKR